MCVDVEVECCEMGSILFQGSMQTWTAKLSNSKEAARAFVIRLKKVEFQWKA